MSQRGFPKWFKQALSRRFDEHANSSAKQHGINKIRLKLNHISDELKEQLESEMILKILEWEETVNHQHSMEKEWLYSEGVKDGMRLMRPICCGGQDSQFNV